MSEHTKESWKFESEENPLDHEMDFFITDAAGINQVCKVDISEANATRIVVCVNACAGVSNHQLGLIEDAGGVADLLNRNIANAISDSKVEQQRDKLLEALKAFMALDEEFSTAKRKHVEEIAQAGGKMAQAVLLARDAITEVEASK